MSRAERAKQFNPFNALRGLQKALRQKELEHERRQQDEQINSTTWQRSPDPRYRRPPSH